MGNKLTNINYGEGGVPWKAEIREDGKSPVKAPGDEEKEET